MNLSIETCVTALQHAAINHKAAVQLELAVGLAVFQMNGGTDKEARRNLVDVYVAAGWDCAKFAGSDYKTVNRRINAAAALFEKVPVSKWIGNLDNMNILQAICEGLAPYEMYTIQDVMRYVAPQKVNKARTVVQPNTGILSGPTVVNHSGQQRIMDQFRRASDQVEGKRLNTEHLSVCVPKTTSREEIIELAMKLLSLAKDSEKELLTA